MSKNSLLSAEDKALFRKLLHDTQPIKQDTVVHPPLRKKQRIMAEKRQLREQSDHSYYFSDSFHPYLAQEGPVRYVREDVNGHELKKLRRGDYPPEVFLDLHGMTQLRAKQELGALIAFCHHEHIFCASVMHGYGKNILRRQTPLWLAQHPQILAFHQAPKQFGGDAALLLLIEEEEWRTVLPD